MPPRRLFLPGFRANAVEELHGSGPRGPRVSSPTGQKLLRFLTLESYELNVNNNVTEN